MNGCGKNNSNLRSQSASKIVITHIITDDEIDEQDTHDNHSSKINVGTSASTIFGISKSVLVSAFLIFLN